MLPNAAFTVVFTALTFGLTLSLLRHWIAVAENRASTELIKSQTEAARNHDYLKGEVENIEGQLRALAEQMVILESRHERFRERGSG